MDAELTPNSDTDLVVVYAITACLRAGGTVWAIPPNKDAALRRVVAVLTGRTRQPTLYVQSDPDNPDAPPFSIPLGDFTYHLQED